MELKLFNFVYKGVTPRCSNRTFMELKSAAEKAGFVLSLVLIVPLWN